MASIQNALNSDSVINQILLSRNHPEGKKYLWVLVEGETDQKLYSKLIDGEYVKVESIPGGVEKLRIELPGLIAKTKRVIGIRDADFLHLNGETEAIAHLFVTDAHDAEMMIVACDAAFKLVISEYLLNQLSEFSAFRERLLFSLVFLGGLRWLNNQSNMRLNFKGIDFSQFYDSERLVLDESACIEDLKKRSPECRHEITIADVHLLIANIADHYNLCNGHDLEKALARHITVSQSKVVKDAVVGSALRLVYRKEDFFKTKLYKCLISWQQQTGNVLFR